MDNFTWMPVNLHRFIANIAFGGSVKPPTPPFASWLHRAIRKRARITTGWAILAILSPLLG